MRAILAACRTWLARLRAHPGRDADRLDDEVRHHLEMLAADYERRGLAPPDARLAARREFGGVEPMKEAYRDQQRVRWIEDAVRDVRFGGRGLARNRGFTAVAVATLAIGIGSVTAIFSVVEALFLRPLPVSRPGELVQLSRAFAEAPQPSFAFSYPLIRAMNGRTDLFDGLLGAATASFTVGDPGALAVTGGAWVTGNYFDVLGLVPLAGRFLTAADDRLGAPPVAVISEAYWRSRFAASPRAVGATLLVERTPVTIVGVAPAGFTGTSAGQRADLMIPVAASERILPRPSEESRFRVPTMLGPNAFAFSALGRPRAGISARELQAALTAAWPALLEAAMPDTSPTKTRLRTARIGVSSGASGAGFLREQMRAPMIVVLALVALVFVTACANVTNLVLARAAARQHELDTRLALGAGRARIVRQLITESVLLSLIGALFGSLLALAGSRALVAFAGQTLARRAGLPELWLDVRLDVRVLLFAAALALAAGIACACVPAVRASRRRVPSPRSAGVAPTARTGKLLVAVQVALSLMLLVGSGLFVRTLDHLRQRDPGFEPGGVLLIDVAGAAAGLAGERIATLYRDLQHESEQIPGVASATLSRLTPVTGGGEVSYSVLVNGRSTGLREIPVNEVAPRYFATMRTRVVAGREFDEGDGGDAPRVAIVNAAFVRQFIQPADPLRQQVSIGGRDRAPLAIVGVVEDVQYHDLRQSAPPTVYLPLLQTLPQRAIWEVRTQPGVDVTPRLRALFESRIPGRLFAARPLAEQVEGSLLLERMLATLSGTFGALALGLASVGLYGLLAYSVTRRVKEIGVRTALGATRGEVARLVVSDALAMIGAGVAVGLPASLLAVRAVRSMMFGLTAADGLVVIVAIAVLVAAGTIAAIVPSRRAAALDPVTALRHE